MINLGLTDSLLTTELNDYIQYIILTIIAVIIGFLYAITYKLYRKDQGFTSDMPITLIILPVIVTAVAMISRVIGIESEKLRTTMGFSLAGIIAITRFRSNPKDTADLSFILSSLITGFLNGLGYLWVAIILTILVSFIYIIVHLTKFSVPSSKEMNLKIMVPEDLNFDDLFNDLLDSYCKIWNLKSVKTTDFGTLYELSFVITLKDLSKEKEFIDHIRERNGNLNITLSVRRFNATIQQ